MNRLWLVIILIFIAANGLAQQYDTVSVFNMPILLDAVVVKSGFDVGAFIRRVQNDTTFYKAFKSMHLKPYDALNDIKVFDKNNTVIASLSSRTRQNINKHCRTTKMLSQTVTGDLYKKNGDYNYYTAELYDYLFFAKKPICNQDDIVVGSMEAHGKGQMEKNKYELKQLIFNPGSKVKGIPFMGDRASIFDEDEKKKYNFKIWIDTFAGQDCYVFKITPKPGYEHKVVYNELTTWFRKSDYAILARDYGLSFNTMFYDFDVAMKVRTGIINGKLYPTSIDYNGNWHIITRKRERVKFKIAIDFLN